MTTPDPMKKFIKTVNFIVAENGYEFSSQTPVNKILKPGVIYPEVFVGCVADALSIEEEEVHQDAINPEIDTVETMFEKLIAHHHPDQG